MADKKRVAIGAMNKRIQYQEYTKQDDGGGGRVETWSTQFTFWANVTVSALQTGAREVKEADKRRDEIQYIFKTRNRQDIQRKGRLVYEGKALSIVTALPTEEDDKDFMKITTVWKGDVV